MASMTFLVFNTLLRTKAFTRESLSVPCDRQAIPRGIILPELLETLDVPLLVLLLVFLLTKFPTGAAPQVASEKFAFDGEEEEAKEEEEEEEAAAAKEMTTSFKTVARFNERKTGPAFEQEQQLYMYDK
jgi:hypothetical protein